jgi:L-alanine-DL-glutamate epimerase-like enolase superfamily enzyme
MNDLRIVDVEFVGLRSRLAAPAVFAWGSAGERNVGLVRVACDDGTVGWGETSVTFPLWSLEERAATVTAIRDLFVGEMIASDEQLVAVVGRARRRTNPLRLLWSHVALSAAIGAIEMAMWDALGKHRRESVWAMLGGETLDVSLYAVGFGGSPEAVADAAAAAIDEGYSTVKVRVGFDPDADERLVRTVSERVGPGVLVDANMAWGRDEAATMIARLEPYRLGWLEEPLSRDDLDGYRLLRPTTDIPIAAGENCYTAEELVALAESGLVDVVMPDLARVGGLSAGIAGARAARGAARSYSPHHYASDVGFSAMLALCAVVGTPDPLVRDVSPWPLRSGLLDEPLDLSRGRARPYRGPGLAPAPRSDVIEEYRVL